MRAILLAALLLLPVASAGEEEERYSDFADATGFHTQKKMTRAPDGTLYYAYVEPTGKDNETDVVVVRVDHDGHEMELPRVRGARGDLARPSITLDETGALHMAWTERADEDREVFAARFVNGAWRDATQLSGGEGYAGFPSLGAARDGSVHVAWYGFDGNFYQTFYREWREGSWLAPVQLSSGPLDANNPSLVVGEDGAVHVAWYKDEGRRYSVWYARRAPEGAWDLARRLPSGGGDALNVALAIDAAGIVHAAWDERDANATRIMHARVGEAPTAIGEGEYPAIARWGDGILIAWAAQNGTLVATDLSGAPRPLAGAPMGRHPALRGATAAPAGDRDATLDILWAAPDEESFEIARARFAPGCAVWDGACASPEGSRKIPFPGIVLLLACLGACAFRRNGQ